MSTDPVTGKEIKRVNLVFNSKDAKLAAALFERQFHNGEYVEPLKITFETMCKDWLKHYESQGAKVSSIRARRIALDRVIDDLGQIPIQKITKNIPRHNR